MHEIMTIDQVSKYLKISKKTIYRLLIDDRFPGFKISGSWQFEMSHIQKWIENQKSELARNKK